MIRGVPLRAWSLSLGAGVLVAGLIVALFGHLWGPNRQAGSGLVVAALGFILFIVGVVANVRHRRSGGGRDSSR